MILIRVSIPTPKLAIFSKTEGPTVLRAYEPGRADVVKVKVVVEGGPQAEVCHPGPRGTQRRQPPPGHGSQPRKGHLVLAHTSHFKLTGWSNVEDNLIFLVSLSSAHSLRSVLTFGVRRVNSGK